MRVELIKRAADVLWDVPDDARKEIILIISATAEAPFPPPGAKAAAFGNQCWVEYMARGNVIQVIDVGCLCLRSYAAALCSVQIRPHLVQRATGDAPAPPWRFREPPHSGHDWARAELR